MILPTPGADHLHAVLGKTGRAVFRLGLSGSYFPGEPALREGIEAGMNYLFWYHWDWQMTRALRQVLPRRREQLLVATGVGNARWMIRDGLDRALRLLRTDYIDVFHLFWVGNGRLKQRTLDLLYSLREQGKLRHIAISTHARTYAGELVRQGVVDVLMMRYNAAHRGAEEEIFPHLGHSNPGVVSYTATKWGTLLKRPKEWPASERIPTAGECYRFVLTNPNVHVCLTAPRNARELQENLAAVRRGPLTRDDMEFMQRFGDIVHGRRHLLFGK